MNARKAAAETLFASDDDIYDIFIPVRSSRSMWRLPNSWDDIPRASNSSNNWKRFRTTQYKEKPLK